MELTITADWEEVGTDSTELTIGLYFAEVYYASLTGQWGWYVREAGDDAGVLLAEGYVDSFTAAQTAAEIAIRDHHAGQVARPAIDGYNMDDLVRFDGTTWRVRWVATDDDGTPTVGLVDIANVNHGTALRTSVLDRIARIHWRADPTSKD